MIPLKTWTNGTPENNYQDGTQLDAADFESWHKEWLALLTDAGIAADATKFDQLSQALRTIIRKQVATALSTAVSASNPGSAAPNFTVAPSPAITAYSANQRFRVAFHAVGTTGNNTLNVSGLGAKSLKQYDSLGAKVAAVVAAGQLADVEYDGVDFVILDPLPPAASQNKSLASVDAVAAANALTVAVAAETLEFRSATLSSGAAVTRTVAAQGSLTVPSGTTLAMVNAQKARLAVGWIDNAGTLEPFVANVGGGVNLDETSLVNTTAINTAASFTGSIAATTGVLTVSAMTSGTITVGMAISGGSAPQGTVITSQLSGTTGGAGTYQTNYYTAVASTAFTGCAGYGIYTATAHTGVAFRVRGFCDISQATAGTWVSQPSLVQPAGGLALAGLAAPGYGQDYQNVTSLRTTGVTYFNTTGREITVLLLAIQVGATIVMTINGRQVPVSFGSASSSERPCSVPIPPWASYSLNSGPGINSWFEKR